MSYEQEILAKVSKVATDVEVIKARLCEWRPQIDQKIVEHSKRLDILERGRWFVLGAAAVVAFIIQQFRAWAR